MSTDVLVALIVTGGVVVTAAGTAIGMWAGRRSTTQSTASSTATEQHVAVDVNDLLAQIARAQAAAATAQAEAAAARAEVSVLREQMGVYMQRERALERDIALRDKRIDDLEGRVAQLETWIRAQGADPELIATGAADAWVPPDED